MANALELSPILKRFEDSYNASGGLSGINGEVDSLNSTIMNSSSKIDEAVSYLRTAGSDNTINSAISNLNLAKDGLGRIKDHVSSDINGILSGIDGVMNTIKDIKENIAAYEAATTALSSLQYQLTTNPSTGNTPTQAEIQEINRQITEKTEAADAFKLKIEDGNKKGEAQLAAVEAAANGISFGVAGNMHDGGVLGPSISYSDNYNFTWQDPDLTAAGAGAGAGDPGTGGPAGGSQDTVVTRTSFADANEYDRITLSQNAGGSDVIAIPRNMREMKDAMLAGQPIILEAGSIFQYDAHGLNFDYYDATDGRKYFIKCDDGYYREVDENGNLVNNKGMKIDPQRVYAAGDNSEQTGFGATWTNDTGLKYNGPPREAKPGPEQTGTEQTKFLRAKEGDAYVGTTASGSKVHNGASNVVAEPKTMREFKEAVANGQPIRLDGVKFIYDGGGWSVRDEYDATKKSIYLVMDEKGYYVEVDSDGKKIRGNWHIDPQRVAQAADNGKFEWDNEWWNPFSWGHDDTVFENWE